MTPEEQKEENQILLNVARELLDDALNNLILWSRREAARIAEQIVEQRIAAIQLQGMDIGGKWLDHPGFRVKPKAKEGE